jgi:acyl-CoA thioesterase I
MIAAGALVVVAAACARGAPPRAAAADSAGVAEQGGAADTLHPTPYTRSIVFLGTSLTAGLGLDPSQAYPAVIQRRLDSLRLPWRAVNAGVSGETSAGALRRIGWVLRDRPRILVVETGANDGLRGMDPDSTRANLESLIRRARGADPGVTIVLAGMAVPTNLGPRYEAAFRRIFPEVAARERLALIPFLLEGVGGVDSLNQADGIHPTAAGQRIVARNVWKVLGPLVERQTGAGEGAGAPGRLPSRTP